MTETNAETAVAPIDRTASSAVPESAAAGVPDFAQLRESLPEDLRGAPSLGSYTSLEALARSHVAA